MVLIGYPVKTLISIVGVTFGFDTIYMTNFDMNIVVFGLYIVQSILGCISRYFDFANNKCGRK
jgi:hypothetical protein